MKEGLQGKPSSLGLLLVKHSQSWPYSSISIDSSRLLRIQSDFLFSSSLLPIIYLLELFFQILFSFFSFLFPCCPSLSYLQIFTKYLLRFYQTPSLHWWKSQGKQKENAKTKLYTHAQKHFNSIATVEMYLTGSVGARLSSFQVREHHSIVIREYFCFLSLPFASK